MLIDEIKKVGLFIARDFKIYFTYKFAVSMAFLSIIFNFVYMVMFGSMFEGSAPAITRYGGNFASYLLVGATGWGFIWAVMSQISESLRTEMELGTLESILATPTSIYTIIISYTIFGSLFGSLSVVGLILTGYILFGVNIMASVSIFTIIIFILSIIMMVGLGMILGGLTVWFKNIGQAAPLIQSITMFFCGVYFPITILPEYLQPISKFIPFYYFIEGLRTSLLPSIPSKIYFYISVLLIFSLIFLLTGAYTIKMCIKKAKKEGTLSFY